jgi:5-methylcytosine-specific restriction protein B
MLEAVADPQHPYLLILDEMNLAHVERYFADVLSGIESDYPVLPNLSRDEEGNWRVATGAEQRTQLPRNLFIVGTVNVDETTYMFSPKVLDRANVFEFRVLTEDLQTEYRKPVACDPGSESALRTFLSVAVDDAWHLQNPAPGLEVLSSNLRSLHRILSAAGMEFGHRVFYEAMRFAAMLAVSGDSDPIRALDLQVLQKVLPRIHGGRRRIEPVLCALGRFTFDLHADREIVEGRQVFDPLQESENPASLPLSYDKIQRMIRSLRANQFVSFTE